MESTSVLRVGGVNLYLRGVVSGKYAILMDGGFVKKLLQKRNNHFPSVTEVQAEVTRIKAHAQLAAFSLLRVYFYDAPPATGKLKNPVDGSTIDLSTKPHFSQNVSLQQKLELEPDFALRQGETAVYGWSVGSAALKSLTKNPRPLQAGDLVPNIEQKGVDLRIGLDIARLSLGRCVEIIVVVTGDSDMVPAFKFARREGVRIYLDHMGHGIKRVLKAHADIIL